MIGINRKTGRYIAAVIAGVFMSAVVLSVPVAAGNIHAPESLSEEMSENRIGGGYSASGQLDGAGYTAKLYDATNGLPTSDANCILGTRDGYVWIGGYSGIIRYDGLNFERLDSSEGLTSGRAIFEDSKGRVWIGTNDNGVVLIEKNIRTHYTYKDGLPSSSIRCFAEDTAGNIFIGTTAGLSYIDRNGILRIVDDERINNEIISTLTSTPEGYVYGVTKNGNIFMLNAGEIEHFYGKHDIGEETVTTIFADPRNEGYVYLGTEEGTVYYGMFGDLTERMKKTNVSFGKGIVSIAYACERIWVATNSTIGYLDIDNRFHELRNIPMHNAIEMVASDYQGNLWLASSRQGVMKVVTNNFIDLYELAGLEEEVVNTTCYYKNNLYIGTDSGLHIINPYYQQIKKDISEYFGTARIRCILEGTDDDLWICTYSAGMGIVHMDSSGKLTPYTEEDGLPDNSVRCASIEDDGSVLVGTNGGLAVIKNEKIVKTVTADDGVENTIFLTVESDSEGNLYAGTDGDGIYVISGTEIKHIGRDDGLSSDVILRIRRDEARGVIWIITSNSIQYLWNDALHTVTSFPYNNNFDMFFDKYSDIWVLSSYGIFSVKASDMINDTITDYKLYTTANGLTSVPTSNSYSCMDEFGNLYISGRTGVNKVNINHFFESVSYLRMGVRSIFVGDEEIIPDAEGVYTIPSTNARITIVPAVLDYTMTNPMIRVYLEGTEDAGITVPRSGLSSLEYTGLKYGNYTLHIQVLDGVTGNAIEETTYTIIKQPRLSELLGMRILLIAVVGLICGLIVWRIMSGTVIRRQYKEIQVARDEAERANSAKSRFLANMSHEIRTPINTIMGMDEMILREDPADVPKPYFLSVINYALDIRDASESLLGLVNDLLDMSKIESGKMNIIEKRYDTFEMLRSLVKMTRIRSNEKDLTFDYDIDENLPAHMYGDEPKVKQILMNLLTNAVKYTDLGGLTLSVSILSKEEKEVKILFSVKDTGIGIKAEDMGKLFNAYERFDEEKNSGIQGTGLGLDISKRFAELMGGSLECSSVYGEGSEFTFTCTQKFDEEDVLGVFDEHAGDESGKPYVPQFIAPDANILVVDDNPMNLTVIKGLLKATRVFVTTAASGEEALDKVRVDEFNVVLLDHMMPGMDGIETLGKIREIKPDLPVYALTANAMSGGTEFYVSKGFNGYLAKPIDSRELEKAIMRHLPEEIMMKPGEEDAVKDLTQIPDELKWLKDVEGINLEDGIKASGGITQYITAINMFRDTIDATSKVIEDAFSEKDIKLFTVKVHALKTSARIVGAGELSAMCEKLEEAGNKNEEEFIAENTSKMLELHRAFLTKLSKLDSGKKEEKPAVNPDELKDAYKALREVVPEMDYDSTEMIIDQVLSYKLPEKDEEVFGKLKTYLKALNWDEMEKLIQDK
ncbi:MAG: response regulator [Lachnospiraceae bacterium]|nr:response regulator [Lachnospiraceae bacterium]